MPQLGTDAVSRLSAPPAREQGGAWKLLMFMAFVFAVFVVSYLGLTFGYARYVENRIATAAERLNALGSEVAPAQQEQLLAFEFRLVNLKNLLARHTALTPVLTLIENNTHQRVYYRAFDVSVGEKRINIQAVADSYDVMAEQLAAFEAMPAVTKVQMGTVKAEGGGKVGADIVLFLDQKVFGTLK